MGCKSCKNKGNKHQPKELDVLKSVYRYFNFGVAVTKYISSGLEDVSLKEYNRRLNVCSGCEHVNEPLDKCLICGCKISLKAKWATEKCPHPEGNKWN